MTEGVYEHHEGEGQAPCPICRDVCSVLAVLVPTDRIRRKGYRHHTRYVLLCNTCFSTAIVMQGKSRMLYRVSSARGEDQRGALLALRQGPSHDRRLSGPVDSESTGS